MIYQCFLFEKYIFNILKLFWIFLYNSKKCIFYMYQKAIKVRLDLNKCQTNMFNQIFGCYRLTYNSALEAKIDFYDYAMNEARRTDKDVTRCRVIK